MKIFDNSIDVYWAPAGGKYIRNPGAISMSNTTWFDPEPALNYLIKSGDKSSLHFQCPAFIDYFKNTYVIKCPVDLDISIKTVNGNREMFTNNYNQFFCDNFLKKLGPMGETKYFKFSLNVSYILYSDESIIMEQIPIIMNHNLSETYKNMCLVPGMFDISKWFRQLSASYEVFDDTKEISFKRGDPLYFVRFRTDKKINLIRTEITEELTNVIDSCILRKYLLPGSSLNDNYNSAKSLLNLYKDKLFKRKKCPFGFGK